MKGLKIRKSEHQRSVTDELPGLSDRERQARLDERFGAGVAFAIADWGNAFWKQSLLDDVEAPARTVMANRITIIDDTQWEQIRRRAKFSQQRFANTQLLGVVERRSKDDKAKGDKTERRTVYFAAGDFAHNFGTPLVMTDDIKYDYNLYWGKVVAANLLRLFPDGHDNIVLAVAHPMKSIGQREHMMSLTLGKHTVKTMDNRTLTFVVREVLPWDEPMGGAVAWASGETGSDLVYNKHELRPGDMIMLNDTGGGVSSMNRLQVDFDEQGRLIFIPVYNIRLSPTIEAGVVHVEENLRDILLQEHKDFRGMGQNLTPTMLSEGIRKGHITLSSGKVDVKAHVRQAESVLLEPLTKAYNGAMAGGRPFRVIVSSGGGQHNYHERFLRELYNHNTVETAVPLNQIHWANLNGAKIIMRQWIEAEIANV